MKKHTGGDWTATTDEVDDFSDVHAEGSEPDGASLFICELHHPNHRADARLVASAPELLEALQRVLMWVPRSTEAACEQDYAFARDAVRKAVGDAP